MKSGKDWKWYGFPGHFVDGGRCAFHLTTRIGGYLISTIGCYLPEGAQEYKEIGWKRKFETYVFTCDGDNSDGDPHITNLYEISSKAYNKSIDAEEGHYRICWKYAEKSEKQ